MFLLTPVYGAIAWFLASLIKLLKKRQFDQFTTRMIAALFYVWILVFNPDLLTSRLWSRFVFLLVPVVEIIVWLVAEIMKKNQQRQDKKNVQR